MPENAFRTDGTIDSFENRHEGRDYTIEFAAPEFTSVCPMTGLPDFGVIRIRYVPADRCIELRSFKYYLFTFRNRGIFYEDLANTLLDDIVAAVHPRELDVIAEMNARGGITATVTASYRAAGRDVARREP
ncbi:MAG: preQ(1) synthase [Dehalococcoidia bacterium]|nr:NADPH-dependent 7-cyano-7-deazaguanine reductase QueF [Dehalococcoidia bacterium]